eukprot:scaffold9208_cov68-Phaeocystis_antarctica.AAC.6
MARISSGAAADLAWKERVLCLATQCTTRSRFASFFSTPSTFHTSGSSGNASWTARAVSSSAFESLRNVSTGYCAALFLAFVMQ